MTQTKVTPGVKSAKKLLRFQLIAARKQRDYEEKRRAYTDLCLKDFKLRQDAIKALAQITASAAAEVADGTFAVEPERTPVQQAPQSEPSAQSKEHTNGPA
jgi:hypothetical protein